MSKQTVYWILLIGALIPMPAIALVKLFLEIMQ